jgi:hypothetical protein
MSSSSQEAISFEFILRIDEDPLAIKRLPDKFVEFVDGAEPAELQLREARCGFCRWPVEVLLDNLTFLYEGDVEMIIKVFDKISCCRHYHTNESGEDSSEDDDS